MSNNLDLAQVAAAQNQKEVTINDQAGQLDAALTEILSVVIDDGDAETLTADQFRRHFFFDLDPDDTPPDGAVTLAVPALRRGLFAVRNDTAQTATVTISGQALSAPTIAAGAAALLYCDGINVQQASAAPGEDGEGAGAFTDLADVPAAYTGHGGKLVRVTTGEDGLEFVALALPYDFGFVKAETPTADEVLGKVAIPRNMTLPADLAGTAGHVDTNPDAQFDIDVTDDGGSIGTISIATDGTFTFTTAGNTAKSVVAGSVIRFVAPNTPDATVAGIAVTLVGTLD